MQIAYEKGVCLSLSDISHPLKSPAGLSALPVYICVLSRSGQLSTKILSAPFCGFIFFMMGPYSRVSSSREQWFRVLPSHCHALCPPSRCHMHHCHHSHSVGFEGKPLSHVWSLSTETRALDSLRCFVHWLDFQD